MKKSDSLQTAYENEFSRFYDQMPYGSAVSLEKMLELWPDWHGMVGVGFAWDLGLTGVPVDHERARTWYHKAEDEGSARGDGETKITIREFRYARHLETDNYLLPVTDRVQAVFRVLLTIVMTSRCESSGRIGVLYTAGLAYSYRLAHIIDNISYEKNPAYQSEEDRAIAAVVEPMRRIMPLYSGKNSESFAEVLSEYAGDNDLNSTSDPDAGPEGNGDSNIGNIDASHPAVRPGQTSPGRAFMQFLLGIMLFDTYRCPVGREELTGKIGEDYRRQGVELLFRSYMGGCTAAAVYLSDISRRSAMGRILVPDVLDSMDAGDRAKADYTETEEKKVRRALRRHESGEDRTGEYLSLY